MANKCGNKEQEEHCCVENILAGITAEDGRPDADLLMEAVRTLQYVAKTTCYESVRCKAKEAVDRLSGPNSEYTVCGEDLAVMDKLIKVSRM